MARGFNGSTDEITTGTGIVFPSGAAGAMTRSVWIYKTAFTNDYEGIAVNHVAGSGPFSRNATNPATKNIAYYIATTGAGGLVKVDPGTAVQATNTWYHVLDTYDTTNGLKTFVNGVSDGTAAANGNINIGAVTMGIGYDPNAGSRIMEGRIADLAFWNVVLSGAQITALANGARPFNINSANLFGWWPLDGLQSPEPDLSGNQNSGTLTSGTTLAPGPPIMMLTPRWPRFNASVAAAASSVVFRKSLSSVGTRVGTRQLVAG